MKIKITADSTCDLNEQLIEKYKFGIIHVGVVFKDELYHDGVDMTIDALFNMIGKDDKLPQTSANNPEEFRQFFEEQLSSDGGYDAIVHFALSSKISCLYQNAQTAAQDFDGKVVVIDSTTLSSAIGVQMIYAHELTSSGFTAQEIKDKVLLRQDRVQASFVIDTLKFLYKGGRCSRLAMFGANLLKIKPVIALKNGTMDVDKKLRGKYDDVVMEYVDYTLSKHNTPDKKHCFITYSTLDNNLVEKIKKRISGIFENIHITRAGTTVGSHCGPNTVGILYYNDGYEKI